MEGELTESEKALLLAMKRSQCTKVAVVNNLVTSISEMRHAFNNLAEQTAKSLITLNDFFKDLNNPSKKDFELCQ